MQLSDRPYESHNSTRATKPTASSHSFSNYPLHRKWMQNSKQAQNSSRQASFPPSLPGLFLIASLTYNSISFSCPHSASKNQAVCELSHCKPPTHETEQGRTESNLRWRLNMCVVASLHKMHSAQRKLCFWPLPTEVLSSFYATASKPH